MQDQGVEGAASFRAGYRAANGDVSLEEAFLQTFQAGLRIGERFSEELGFWEREPELLEKSSAASSIFTVSSRSWAYPTGSTLSASVS